MHSWGPLAGLNGSRLAAIERAIWAEAGSVLSRGVRNNRRIRLMQKVKMKRQVLNFATVVSLLVLLKMPAWWAWGRVIGGDMPRNGDLWEDR